MKQKKNKIRLKLAQVLIFSLFINSFATSMNSNDGSAFISKAEFDALKSSFQSQIDTYNQNIDSKIDNAIASYLNGVTIKKESEYSLPLANWKKVTAINGWVDPIFQYPSVNLSKTRTNRNHGSAAGASGWRRNGYTFINLAYNQIAAKSIRPCVLGMKENFSSITRMYWNGVYKDWKETIEADIVKSYATDLYAIEIAGYTKLFYFYQLNKFLPLPDGYKSDLNTYADSVWKGGFSYYSNYNGHGFEDFETGGTIKSKILTLSIEATKDENNYTHIIEYCNRAGWEVYNPTFTHTFRKSELDTLKTKKWWNGGAGWPQTKDWNELKYLYNAGDKTFTNVTRISGGTINVTEKNYKDDTDTDAEIPRIGLVATNVKASDIKQDKEVVQVARNGAMQSAHDVNIVNGFVLLYGLKDEKITWQPKFINLMSADGVVSTTSEVEMRLSMTPFSNEATVSDATKILKVNATYSDDSVIKDTTTPYTSGKTVKLEWEMADDGFVYIKWFPKRTELPDPSYLTDSAWQIDLDLENCGSYKSELPNK